jgi:hypothetical protein
LCIYYFEKGDRYWRSSVAIPLEHDPEKAWPGLDPGWKPVFGKDHAPTLSWIEMTIRRKVISV